MDGISTITQKGQVAIPKSIRDYFGLKPSDQLHFSIGDNKIVAEPILTVTNMRGFISAKRSLSSKEMKSIVKNSVNEKYANHS